jgi:hypothetical protein
MVLDFLIQLFFPLSPQPPEFHGLLRFACRAFSKEDAHFSQEKSSTAQGRFLVLR